MPLPRQLLGSTTILASTSTKSIGQKLPAYTLSPIGFQKIQDGSYCTLARQNRSVVDCPTTKIGRRRHDLGPPTSMRGKSRRLRYVTKSRQE